MKIQCPNCFHELTVQKKKKIVKTSGRLDDPTLVRKTKLQINQKIQSQLEGGAKHGR